MLRTVGPTKTASKGQGKVMRVRMRKKTKKRMK